MHPHIIVLNMELPQTEHLNASRTEVVVGSRIRVEFFFFFFAIVDWGGGFRDEPGRSPVVSRG